MVEVLITDEVNSNFEGHFFEMIAEKVLNKLYTKLQDIQISLLITDDEQIKQLNALYRNIDKPTDVLSFPQFEKDEEINSGMLGDIVVSFDTLNKQASEADISEQREMAFLFIHGLLHLLGYDHERSEEEENIMFELQESILLELVNDKFVL